MEDLSVKKYYYYILILVLCLLYLLCLSRFELVWPAEQVPVCLMVLKFSLQVQDCKGPSGVCQTQWPMGTEADRHHWPRAHREPGHLVIMSTCVFQLLDFCFGSIGQVWSLSKTEKNANIVLTDKCIVTNLSAYWSYGVKQSRMYSSVICFISNKSVLCWN